MVFAWPEPPNARFAGKSAGARCGVQETCASGGTEAPTNRPGKKSLPGSMQRWRTSVRALARLGSFATFTCHWHVRLTPNSDRKADAVSCRLRAGTGLMHCSKQRDLAAAFTLPNDAGCLFQIGVPPRPCESVARARANSSGRLYIALIA